MKRDPVHESCSGGRTGCDAVRVLRSRPALAGGVEPRMAGGHVADTVDVSRGERVSGDGFVWRAAIRRS